MKKIKHLFALLLCCIVLCQPIVDHADTDYPIETYEHHNDGKKT